MRNQLKSLLKKNKLIHNVFHYRLYWADVESGAEFSSQIRENNPDLHTTGHKKTTNTKRATSFVKVSINLTYIPTESKYINNTKILRLKFSVSQF